MSRRGHLYGMISIYHHSWFLKTDGLGNLLISDAVGADACGDAEHVSVTEVCQVENPCLAYGSDFTVTIYVVCHSGSFW